MPDVRESIEIEAPAEEVWALVMDPDRLGDWVTAHRDASGVPDRPLEPGDEFNQKLCVAGKSFNVDWELIEARKPEFAVWKAKGPKGAGADVRYELSGNGDGTRFEYTNDFDLPGGPLKFVAGGIAGRPAKRAARKSLRRLKKLLER